MVRQTAKHIEEFYIESYRGIKKMRLSDLNDINILTGNNNSGKTSVLELISSMENPLSISTWIKMCRLDRNSSYYSGLLNLFPADREELGIWYRYGIGFDETIIGLEAKIQEEQITEAQAGTLNNIGSLGLDSGGSNFLDVKYIDFTMYVDNEKRNDIRIYDIQTRMSVDKFPYKSFPMVYVSSSTHVYGNLLLDEVMESPELYQKMMTILREFDDSIINIITSANGNGRGTEYMVLSSKYKRAMPLSAYGDGMKKALVLLAAVVKAKNGVLLLDEFETAIHTSAMDHIFSWILNSAQKLNVQVFLTSHSLEAIGKVLR